MTRKPRRNASQFRRSRQLCCLSGKSNFVGAAMMTGRGRHPLGKPRDFGQNTGHPQDARERRGWDSNPRCPFRHAGFQDRCIQPLCHLSEGRILTWPRPAWVARHTRADRFPTCLEMRSPTTRPGPNAGQDSPTGTLEKSQLEGAAEGLVWPETGAGPVENRAPQSCSRNHPNRPLCRGSKRLLTLSGVPGYHPAPFLQGAGQTHGFRLCRA